MRSEKIVHIAYLSLRKKTKKLWSYFFQLENSKLLRNMHKLHYLHEFSKKIISCLVIEYNNKLKAYLLFALTERPVFDLLYA